MTNFLLGMLTAIVALPVLDGLVSLILTGIETLKMKLGVAISKGNKQIEDLHNSSEPARHIIGFGIPSDEESYEDDEDDI